MSTLSNDEFPTEYDAIVLGTGMAESIVAAALSRIGQKVLHLDRNKYYSGDWSCFHFESLQRWISENSDDGRVDIVDIEKAADPKSFLEDGESLLGLNIASASIRNVREKVFIPAEKPKAPEIVPVPEPTQQAEKQSEEDSQQTPSVDASPDDASSEDASPKDAAPASSEKTETAIKQDGTEESVAKGDSKESPTETQKEWTMEELKSQWRKFNIDLIPKVLYCRGPMVELLISSDIAKYCEFKTISRVLTYMNGKLEQVPCSRSDVFSSKQVSLIEKRLMMKFLTFALDYQKHPEQYEGKEDMTFTEYLKSHKLTPNLQHFIKQAIAMATDTTNTMKGLASTQKFLQSLGRYGNTAFLWPVYGAGELPQCFCRMCAVFGGIYCLHRTAQALIVGDDNKCIGIVDTESKRIKTKYLIMDTSYAGQELLEEEGQDRTISRAILITDRTIKGDSDDHITLLSMPTEDGRNVTIYELGSSSYACPKDLYVVHLTCEGSSTKTPQEDFADIIEKLFRATATPAAACEGECRPTVLWSLYYSVQDSSSVVKRPSTPDNVYLVAGPDTAMDFDQAITQARAIFEQICPGEEFLPKAPNPEDIIWDDGEGTTPEDSGFKHEDEEDNGDGEKKEEEETKGDKTESVEAKEMEANKEEGSDKKEEGVEKEEETKGDKTESGEAKEMEAKKEEGVEKEKETKREESEDGGAKKEASNAAKAKGDEAQTEETIKEDKVDDDKEQATGEATTDRKENEGKDEQ